ncbi:MAG: FprA family A-type flavoprotein [Acidilobaceae archaeon]
MVKVIVSRVTPSVYLLRLNDFDTVYFEGLWRIREGITYNAYVVVGPEGAIVIDGWKRGYGELFVESLRRVVDLKDVKLVVFHHTEPDHSGSLPQLIKELDNTTVLAHPIAKGILEAFYGLNLKFKSVSDGETVKSEGLSLKFFYTPWLHWPDTIVSYLEEEGVFFTCDVFGSYGVPSSVFYEDLPEDEKSLFVRHITKYFANVIGSYRQWVIKNLVKIEELVKKAKVIAPGHGPLYRDHNFPLSLYTKLGSEIPSRGKALVLYFSMYGFSQELAELITEKLKSKGLSVALWGATSYRRDDESEIVADAYDSEYLILVAPIYETKAFPLASYLLELILSKIPTSGRKVLVISTYGWASGAGKKLVGMLIEKGFTSVELVEVRGLTKEQRRAVEQALDKLIEKGVGTGI